MQEPHRTFPEEREWPNPLPESLERSLPDPLFCFPFHLALRFLPPPSRELLTHQLYIKLCKGPAVLILACQRPNFVAPTNSTHHTSTPTGVRSSARPLAGPGPSWFQGAPLLSDQQSNFFPGTSSFPTPRPSGPGYQLNSEIPQIFTRYSQYSRK